VVIIIKLSIIIPHYNSVNTLEKLLLTIPKLNEIEIIVIDDKSNKDLEKLNMLINSNRFSNVTFLVNNTNKKGAGVCRNIGLKRAKGEWILFADADDFFLDDFYDIVSSYFNTDNDVVFFIPSCIESDTGKPSNILRSVKNVLLNYINNKNYKSELLLRYSFFNPWSKLIKADFLKKNKIYFDEIIAANDLMFSIKVGHLMRKFDVSSETIYCYTVNKGSVTFSINEENFDAHLLTHINYYHFLKSNLKPHELKYFDLSSAKFIYRAFKYYGIKKAIHTLLILKKEKIKIFDYKFFNPFYTFSKFISYFSKKRFYVKN